jgi:hypothetical protein
MANTAWSTTDKTASATLSNSNLTITSASSAQGARGADRQVAGQFYFEITPTSWTAGGAVGVANSQATFTSSTLNTATVGTNGNIVVNNVNTGVTLGTIAAASTVGIAVDLTNRRIWFRIAPSGNWNGNAGYAPNTGVGGVDISPAGGVGIPLHPFAYIQANPQVYTANFGDTAFVGAVPSGYTSGFTAGASVPTNAIASQALAEHWLTTNPDARITQVSLEHWASVASGNLQAVVTQVLLEHWTSVAVVVPAAGGPMVTMIH